MITGKEMHAIFANFDDHAHAWDDITQQGQSAYDAVAYGLNTFHVVPLQGIVDAQQSQIEKLKTDIKDLKIMDRKIFDEQDREIVALKALTLAWQQYVKDDDDDMPLNEHFNAEYEAAKEQRAKLEQRTKEILRKEQ